MSNTAVDTVLKSMDIGDNEYAGIVLEHHSISLEVVSTIGSFIKFIYRMLKTLATSIYNAIKKTLGLGSKSPREKERVTTMEKYHKLRYTKLKDVQLNTEFKKIRKGHKTITVNVTNEMEKVFSNKSNMVNLEAYKDSLHKVDDLDLLKTYDMCNSDLQSIDKLFSTIASISKPLLKQTSVLDTVEESYYESVTDAYNGLNLLLPSSAIPNLEPTDKEFTSIPATKAPDVIKLNLKTFKLKESERKEVKIPFIFNTTEGVEKHKSPERKDTSNKIDKAFMRGDDIYEKLTTRVSKYMDDLPTVETGKHEGAEIITETMKLLLKIAVGIMSSYDSLLRGVTMANRRKYNAIDNAIIINTRKDILILEKIKKNIKKDGV